MAGVLGSINKPIRPDGKPRKACSAYHYYVKDNYHKFGTKDADGRRTQSVYKFRKCFERWKQEDEATKAIYNKLAADDKERYQREMKTYNERIKKGELAPPPIKKYEHVRNAYDFFCKEVRKKVHEDNPKWTVSNVMKLVGQMWRELPEGDKEPYMAKRDEEIKQYRARQNQMKDEKKRAKERARKKKTIDKCRERLDRLTQVKVPAPELVETPP